jgi:hypothetical protein
MHIKLPLMGSGGMEGMLRMDGQNIMQSANAIKKDVDNSLKKEARFAKTGKFL